MCQARSSLRSLGGEELARELVVGAHEAAEVRAERDHACTGERRDVDHDRQA